jgi:hypothetical protein
VHQGSSIGIGMASRRDELERVLRDAFAFDPRVLVEERIVGTELTAAVIGNRELTALPLVEIVAKRAFFDYEAKYDPAASEEICPARVSDAVAREAQEIAMRAHRALGCRGLSRTDLIATADRGLFVLELNTLPGMTVNSLLPKAARAAGIPFSELLDAWCGWRSRRSRESSDGRRPCARGLSAWTQRPPRSCARRRARRARRGARPGRARPTPGPPRSARGIVSSSACAPAASVRGDSTQATPCCFPSASGVGGGHDLVSGSARPREHPPARPPARRRAVAVPPAFESTAAPGSLMNRSRSYARTRRGTGTRPRRRSARSRSRGSSAPSTEPP